MSVKLRFNVGLCSTDAVLATSDDGESGDRQSTGGDGILSASLWFSICPCSVPPPDPTSGRISLGLGSQSLPTPMTWVGIDWRDAVQTSC